MSKTFQLFVLWALFDPIAATIAVTADAAGAADRVSVRVLAIDQNDAFVEQEGVLTGWTHDFLEMEQRKIPMADVVALEWDRPQPPDCEALIVLGNGDQLNARVSSLDAIHAVVHWTASENWPELELPLETIAGFTPRLPRTPTSRDRVRRHLDGLPPTRDDYLFLSNGDRFAGELTAYQDGTLQIRPTGAEQPLAIAADRVMATRFNPDLVSFPTSQGRHYLVELVDGSRLTARTAVCDGELLQLALPFDRKLTLPETAVRALRVLGGRAVELSALTPRDFQHRPFLSGEWNLGINRAVTGTPLRLEGEDYARGLGVHSYSEVTYRLDRSYTRFRCLIGLDDSSQQRGSVEFRVVLDGTTVYRSGVVTGADRPVLIENLDVRNAHTLTLIVDFAERGDILDRANWCHPLLIRSTTGQP